MDKMNLRMMNNVFNLFDSTNEVVEKAVTDFLLNVLNKEENKDCLDISKHHIKVDVQNSYTDEYNSYTLLDIVCDKETIGINAYDNYGGEETILYFDDLTLIDKVLISKWVYNNIVENYEKI